VAAARRAALAAALVACAGCGAHHSAAGCGATQLRLATGTALSEKTGQHTLEIDVTNVAGHSCTVDGYPTISFTGPDGSTLPFRYSRRPDQMIRAQTARQVTIPPGGRAHFLVNKYRCDIRALAKAASLGVQLPSDPTVHVITLPPGARSIDYCRETPSLTIHISPVTGPVP
jgi:Domain of unknown function (DUF4232)